MWDIKLAYNITEDEQKKVIEDNKKWRKRRWMEENERDTIGDGERI